jgi:transcriptional regulator with XRE-family HTH domain
MPAKNRKWTLRKLFAANLRREREALGLNQQDLAQLAGLHRVRIDTVERGMRNITVDHIERLARALKLEPADLVRLRD